MSLLDTAGARDRSLAFLRDAIADFESPATVIALLAAVRGVHAKELIPELRRMHMRLREKRLGRPFEWSLNEALLTLEQER
jgi:hypothetical protein